MTSKQYGPHEPYSEGSTGRHEAAARPEGGPAEREVRPAGGLTEREVRRGDGAPEREARSEGGLAGREVRREGGAPEREARSEGGLAEREVRREGGAPERERGRCTGTPDDNGAMGDGTGRRGAPRAGSGPAGEDGLGAEGDLGAGDGLGAEGGEGAEGGPGRTGGLGGGIDLGGAGGLGGLGGPGGGEEELRNLLQSAVQDLEPSPDSLDHLRRAVPARRRRRRHAVVGAAAVLLFGGTAMPAMLHVANGGDDAADRQANAASSSQAHVTSGGTTGGPARQHTDRPADKDGKKGDKGDKKTGKDKGEGGSAEQSGGPAADPAATMDVTSPACLRAQLGNGSASVAAPDAEGRVYGALRVVNVSTTSCSVDGGGSVVAVAQGSADPARVQVVDHTAGDAAPGLPDPATAPGQLVLKPGEAYEVKFAWIPAEGGGTSGCAAPGTPTPGSSEGAGGSEPANTAPVEGNGDQTGGGSEAPGDGGVQAASVAVSHTPEAGEPSAASTTLNDACAGTVYRTGALPAQ
ncbi:hypothetical protein [Streptomyces niger]|uniref:hypothetical protein n=1 Tax=Streptomyces niger TaxID=66373 RepID=UPI000AE63ADC|nr:hypothetical protein [Streptomyces niger]